jgi:hypothetical protein
VELPQTELKKERKKERKRRQMKISLRKANALQLLINEQINSPFVVTVGKFDNPVEVVDQAADILLETVGQKFDLITVLYAIRGKVAAAGQVAGVADLLTTQALLSKREAFLRQLASTTSFAVTKESLDSQLADIKAADATGYRAKTFTVGLLKKETVEAFKKNIVTIRRQKQKVSDQLLNLNVKTEIELSDEEVSFLNKYEIL